MGRSGRPIADVKPETKSPFRRLRLNAKLSQKHLAKKIGVDVSTIRRWEKGQSEPTMTIAQTKRFCGAVKQNLSELPESLMPSPN